MTSPLVGDVGVVGDESHAKGHRALGHQGTNLAQTNDTEGLAVEFHAFPLRTLPLSVLQGRVGLRDVASLRQNERHGLLGGREDVRDGGIHHHHAQFRRLGDVNVVEADTGATDHDQVLARFERGGVNLRRGANNQRVRADNGVEKCLG